MPHVSRLTARVAGYGLRQQVANLDHAEDLAGESESIIRRHWRAIVKRLAAYDDPFGRFKPGEAAADITAILAAMDRELEDAFVRNLGWLAVQSHTQTADTLAAQLPLNSLKATLTEDESGPGIVKLLLGRSRLRVQNLASPLDNPDLSDTAKRDLMRELIFPPPDPRQVFGIVYAGDWRKRLEANTKLAAPRGVARVIQQGFVAGASQREIAKALLPVLDGVRISARRVAHNESMRVAHTMQHQAWAEVDDLIAGYQIHAVDDGHNPTSRPEHRARHETVYYKKPRGSQKGLDQRPNPPYEADGSLAHFCRCWLTPVWDTTPPMPAERATSPLDPEVVSSWFDDAKPSQRRAAVGNARYAFVADMLDREPNWMDFIDAAGRLLSLDALRTLFQVG
jgi:hypothetical protein